MARPNFEFQKRQKELARKKKKEQKRQAKLDKKTIKPEDKSDHSQKRADTDAWPTRRRCKDNTQTGSGN